MNEKRIHSVLISVYNKHGLYNIIKQLSKTNTKFFSTGGTQRYIESFGFNVTSIEDITSFPEILGGRVKTLHPQIMGGILFRRDYTKDLNDVQKHHIPEIDMVIVDLYPFEETVSAGEKEEEIIEKIDIGGVSLLRAAAKNYQHVAVVASRAQYDKLLNWLTTQNNSLSLEQRKELARDAFNVTSHYDTLIYQWFSQTDCSLESLKVSYTAGLPLRYGENPHQKAVYYGDLNNVIEKLNGKELSYNNLLDIDAAISLIDEFDECTCAIIKHTNACGIASDYDLKTAFLKALQADTVSAFGGIIIANNRVDLETALEINKLFYEILIAPDYDETALQLLREKKNRIVLKRNPFSFSKTQFKTVLNGVLVQEKDWISESYDNLICVTQKQPTQQEKLDMLFACKVVKHTKSNAIVLAKNKMMLASGTGQTSRVDALKQAIEKAQRFGFNLNGAVMASDAFFPFPDCVEIAYKAGIRAVIQPGGSVKDADSIAFCDQNEMSMVITGYRHFKH